MTKKDRRNEVKTEDNGLGQSYQVYEGFEIWTKYSGCYYFHKLGDIFDKKTYVQGSFNNVLDRIDELLK